MKTTGGVFDVSVACLTWAALWTVISAGDVKGASEDGGQTSSSSQIGKAQSPGQGAEKASGVVSPEQLRRQRKQAAHRRRRIIFNNDGNEPVYYLEEATPEAFLACRTAALLGTQVDTIFYCTWSSGFSNFTHNTKVGDVFTCKEDKLAKNKTDQFIAQGTDPLKIMVDFCHGNAIELFWSMRMNDTHDASSAWYGPLLFPQLKKDHPEYLLGSKEKKTKYGRWTGVDYGREEIRDLAYRYVEEVCENYDVDGVELDFFRHLNYFKGPAMGEDATGQEREMMTGLIRRIRQMTERMGRERGRPILVAVRVPDSVGYSNAMGLDVVRWMQDDLIDVLVPGGYFRLNPWETSVELGHKYGVPVYPCLSESRLKGEAGEVRKSLDCYRARAMNVWQSGADGVYLFNFFNPHSPLWSELGDPVALQAMDKVYTTGARGVRTANSWLADGLRFLGRSPVSPERPLMLKPGETAVVALRVGEQVGTGGAEGLVPEVTLRLNVRELGAADEVAVKLNGQPLTDGKKSGDWIDYSVDPRLVAKGDNRFEITPAPGSKKKPALQDVLLWVRYKKGRSQK